MQISCFPLGDMNLVIWNHFAWIVLYDRALSSTVPIVGEGKDDILYRTQCPRYLRLNIGNRELKLAFTLMTIPDTMDSWTPYFNHYAFWNLELVLNVSIFRWRASVPLVSIVSQFVVEFVLVSENSVMFQSCVVFPQALTITPGIFANLGKFGEDSQY